MTTGVTDDPATAGPEHWQRFDTWAERARDYAEQAVVAAEDESKFNRAAALSEQARYDPRSSTLMDAARLCVDLARAAIDPTGTAPPVAEMRMVTMPGLG